MESKDYYKILELSPSATLKEIKAAYRRLAHKFHPDKSRDDLYALAQFNLVKEAYEVLTDPVRKEYYLQQRWYEKTIVKKASSDPATPVTILRNSLNLDKQLAHIDVYRMNAGEIWLEIDSVLSDENIEILNRFNEHEINTVIVQQLSSRISILPRDLGMRLAAKLRKINVDDDYSVLIDRAEKKAAREQRLEKLHPWIISAIVIAICFLIYSISN